MVRYTFKYAIIFLILGLELYSCDDPKVKTRGDGRDKDAEKELKKNKKTCEKLDNSQMIVCLMNSYLSVYKLDPNGFCTSSNEDCKKSVERYDDRCFSNADDCIKLDSVNLVKLTGGDVYVPDLIQAEAANFVFKKSGARKNCEIPSASCVGQCNCHCDVKQVEWEYKRDRKSFNESLAEYNISKLGKDGNSDNDLLNQLLYISALYYNEFYLYHDDGDKSISNKNLQKVFRDYSESSGKKWLSKRRRNNEIKIYVPYCDLDVLTDALAEFLYSNPLRKHEKMAKAFAKVFRHTLVKAVPVYKHSYLMADYLKSHPINLEKYSDPYSPNGHELMKEYLDRCKNGQCYMFDDYKLFEEDAEMNFIVPQLSEVNLLFSLLDKLDFYYSGVDSLFRNNSRRHAEIKYMTPRLLRVNKTKFQSPDNTHMIIQTFLYYSAIYFVKTYRENWLNRNIRHIANWDVLPKMKQFLIDDMKRYGALIIKDDKIREITSKFREYLSNSYYKAHPKRVKRYTENFEAALIHYNLNQINDRKWYQKPWVECN